MNIFDVLRKEANMKSWKKEELQEEKKIEYKIPDGGDFNLYCKFDKNLDLEKIKNEFVNHNIKVEYKINDNRMSFSLDDTSSDEVNVISEIYGFNEEYKKEMIEDYIADFGNNTVIINILKEIDSNYYFKAKNYRESVVVCILAYLLSEQTDTLLYDCFNGCYLCKNDLYVVMNGE